MSWCLLFEEKHHMPLSLQMEQRFLIEDKTASAKLKLQLLRAVINYVISRRVGNEGMEK